MKHFYLLVTSLTILFSSAAVAQSCYDNPSLEGPSQPHVVPVPWYACYGSPDTQPGQWGITLPPSDGNSYVSFLHSGPGITYNEGMTQLLNPCLQAGTQYSFTVDLAHSPVYNTADPLDCYSSLAVYAGATACAQTETLWTSGMITNPNWQTYTITFTPAGSWCYLSFSPYHITACSGFINVLMDNISCVAPSGQVAVTNVSCYGDCDGMAIANPITGTPPFTYSWSPGVWPNNDTITGLCPGSYILTLTDDTQQQFSYPFDVLEPDSLIATATGTNPLCNGQSNGSVTVTQQGGTSSYTYNWTPGNVTTQTYSNIGQGQYIVQVTDANGCIAYDTVTITSPSPVVVTAPNVMVCLGQNGVITASASGGTGGYNYSWDNGTFIGNPYNIGPVNTPSTHTVIATDANGCQSAPIQVTVTPGGPVGVVVSADTAVCPGQNAVLTAMGTGGDGNYTYSWSPGGQTSNQITVNPSVVTTYIVTVGDGCGSPPVQDTIVVNMQPVPVVSFNVDPDQGCPPLCVNFSDATTVTNGTIVSWSWSFGDGDSSNAQDPSHCYDNTGTYDVSLAVVSDLGCPASLSIPGFVTAYPEPTACFTIVPNPATLLDPTVEFVFCGSTDNPSTFEWDFGVGAGKIIGHEIDSNTYSDTGTYIILLVVTNSFGCVDSIYDTLVMLEDPTLVVPNVFSPNGDGANDEFLIKGLPDSFVLKIFNRWGIQVFASSDKSSMWNGKINNTGPQASGGTYYWILDDLTNGKDFHGFLNVFY